MDSEACSQVPTAWREACMYEDCILHPKIPRLLHCQNILWFLQYIFLIFGFRVLKSNQIVLLHCSDMGIPFGVIRNLHKKVVSQNSKVLNS